MINDSIEFAIYTRIGELAERWGIKPYEFRAFANWSPEDETIYVRYISARSAINESFEKMLTSLDFGKTDSGRALVDFRGSPEDVFGRFDKAIAIAPRVRLGFS